MTVYQTLCLDLGTHKYIRHNLWLQGDNVIEETAIQANYNHILTFRAQKRDHMRGCLIQLPYFRDELTMKSKKIKKPAQVPKGRRGTSTLCFSVLLTSGLSHPPHLPTCLFYLVDAGVGYRQPLGIHAILRLLSLLIWGGGVFLFPLLSWSSQGKPTHSHVLLIPDSPTLRG